MFRNIKHLIGFNRRAFMILLITILLNLSLATCDVYIVFPNHADKIFRPTEDVVFGWGLKAENNAPFYRVNVTDSHNNTIWEERYVVNMMQNNGSRNLGPLPLGSYTVWIRTESLDGSPRYDISYMEHFRVECEEKIIITKFNDADGDGIQDPGETGLKDWSFKYGKVGSALVTIPNATDNHGNLTILCPEIGEYIIQEVPKAGWSSTGCLQKIVNVSRGSTKQVVFGNVMGLVAFDPKEYDFNVSRNYSQRVFVTIVNSDNQPHRLEVNLTNPFVDIYLGFLGPGSMDMNITMQPKERRKIELVIHAQDALQENYSFEAHLIDSYGMQTLDRAIINVQVVTPPIEFEFKEVGTDPLTQIKTFRITNNGGPLTDLTVWPEGNLAGNVIISPQPSHADLGENAVLEFEVCPIWLPEISSIRGKLWARAGRLSKDRDVDFSCGGEYKMHQVVLRNPLLHFDFEGGNCINAQHIKETFTLPPGLKRDNVQSASVQMQINPRTSSIPPYNTRLSINNNLVQEFLSTNPSGGYYLPVNQSFFNYADAGMAENTFTLDTDMPQSYTTILKKIRITLCLDELVLHVCAKSPDEAEKIAWNAPWIFRPYSQLNVKVEVPKNGSNLTLNNKTVIRVKVTGESGPEKLAHVSAIIGNNRRTMNLADNGLCGDGMADDGIYASGWIPDVLGWENITIMAENCVAFAQPESVMVNITKPITIPGSDRNSSELSVIKLVDPRILSKSDPITYTIIVCPNSTQLRDVSVVDTLPCYMRVNSSSFSQQTALYSMELSDGWQRDVMSWNLGNLDHCWTVSFSASFLGKVPADEPSVPSGEIPISEVTYTNRLGNRTTVFIPSGQMEMPQSRGTPPNPKPEPSVGGAFSIMLLLAAASILKRKR